jgi:hypothetical protein
MDTVEQPKQTLDVFQDRDLLTRLLIHQADLGYRLGTFYTACTTAYVALAGIAAQYYFALMPHDRERAFHVALFGFLVSLFGLAAPFGLRQSCHEIASSANRYAAALGLPPEKFTVIRFGAWLSLIAFLSISIGWASLVRQAL